MPAKDFLFERRARAQIGAGVDALADVVKVTLGPRGRRVLIDRAWGSPTVTKDGASVATEVELKNSFSNLGAQMVREVASKTSEVVGDGTTTAIVLAQAIYSEGLKMVAAGANPIELKRGIDAAVACVVSDLATQSKAVSGRDDIARIGTLSANGDASIGGLIAEAMERVGEAGVVTVEEGTSMETSLEFEEGMQLDRGYLSAYFVTDAERMDVAMESPVVLVCGKKLSSAEQVIPLLERVLSAEKPLLIIAEEVSGEALATLVVNGLRGALKVCAVKAPGYGDSRSETLTDIAVLLGTRVVSDDLGLELEDLTLKDLGRARSVTVDKDRTVLVGGAGRKRALDARVRQLRAQLEDTTSEPDRDALQARLAKLTGGVAVLTLGAATEIEMKERKSRVEDALNATRAALEEGVVPGGGVALVRAAAALKTLKLRGDQRLGLRILRRAIEEPLRQMARNARLEGAVVVDRVREGAATYGYNFASDKYEDLMASGVIDPTKVVRVALQNAASVAGLMLSTEALIVDHTEHSLDDARS